MHVCPSVRLLPTGCSSMFGPQPQLFSAHHDGSSELFCLGYTHCSLSFAQKGHFTSCHCQSSFSVTAESCRNEKGPRSSSFFAFFLCIRVRRYWNEMPFYAVSVDQPCSMHWIHPRYYYKVVIPSRPKHLPYRQWLWPAFRRGSRWPTVSISITRRKLSRR